jgi:23S rRNA (uracil1939-C5)-methyltransferase
MQVARDAQLEAKQAIAAGALRKLVARGLELRPPLAPVPPLRWRRRARLHWADGVLGFHAPRSHRLTDIASCLQLDERLDAALAAIRAAVRFGGAGDVHLLLGHRGDVHVVFSAPVDGAEALIGQAGITGAPAIEIEDGLLARADEFAQATAAGNAALIAEVIREVAPRAGLRVLELFAGAGNFTRHLVAAGAEVVANDVVTPVPRPPRFIAGPAERAVARLHAERFDALLLDPPRTGAREALAAVAAMPAPPPRVIYVSCDVATLARDLELLAAAGWAPRHAQVLDLMPQTAHLEVVAVMEQ